MLKVDRINVHYGAIHALRDVSLNVNQGEIVTLIGANGAGKSTLLKAITGLQPMTNGTITFESQEFKKINPQRMVKSGISLVPEGRRVFAGLSVEENLELGAHLRKDKKEIALDMKKMYETFPILKERRNQDCATLSGGEQQMLAMARALMSRPSLLLLDEPSMGLAPLVIKQIFDIIVDINKTGTTILLIEQNAHMALKIADRGYVIENGEIVVEGLGKELLESEAVKKAYLGG